MNNNQPIGIFDSGLGGISVLNECIKQCPNEHFIYYGDSEHAPYGLKSIEEITKLCIQICDYFVLRNVKCILIACNTATSAAAQTLRERYSIPIIGMEPALKPATKRKDAKTIAVLATPFTLKEQKFKTALHQYDASYTIYPIPCPKFVDIVEEDLTPKKELVFQQLDEYKDTFDLSNIDVVVLGCTHFSFLAKDIQSYFPGNPILVDGTNGTIQRLKIILDDGHMASTSNHLVELHNSSSNPIVLENAKRLVNV